MLCDQDSRWPLRWTLAHRHDATQPYILPADFETKWEKSICKINEFTEERHPIYSIISWSQCLRLAGWFWVPLHKSNRTKPKSTQTAESSTSQRMTEKGEFYHRLQKSSLPPTHKKYRVHEQKFLEGSASLRVEGETAQTSQPLLWLRIGCAVIQGWDAHPETTVTTLTNSWTTATGRKGEKDRPKVLPTFIQQGPTMFCPRSDLALFQHSASDLIQIRLVVSQPDTAFTFPRREVATSGTADRGKRRSWPPVDVASFRWTVWNFKVSHGELTFFFYSRILNCEFNI